MHFVWQTSPWHAGAQQRAPLRAREGSESRRLAAAVCVMYGKAPWYTHIALPPADVHLATDQLVASLVLDELPLNDGKTWHKRMGGERWRTRNTNGEHAACGMRHAACAAHAAHARVWVMVERESADKSVRPSVAAVWYR